MFTGIVVEKSKIQVVEKKSSGLRIEIVSKAAQAAAQKSGQSVAINGICLTLVEDPVPLGTNEILFKFDVSDETLARTPWGKTMPLVNEFVHVEFPLSWGDPLGGHLVTGHVEGIAQVAVVKDDSAGRFLTLEIDSTLANEIGTSFVSKGSVAVNGVSLTLNSVRKMPSGGLQFDLYLIPHTLNETCLGQIQVGDFLNIESDLLLKTSRNQISESSSELLFPKQTGNEKVESAIAALKAGRLIILVDDEDRENEGDLVAAAEFATAESINFMAREGRGLICLALDGQQVDKLGLPLMTTNNEAPYGTAFTVSVEARSGVTTGISAHDRARTIQAAIADNAKREDLVVPGHVFPLRARDGGVLVRAGQTEGSVDLARLAGLKPAAVICEILNDDGTMARMESLEKFSRKFQIPLVSIADLIEYRLQTDATLVKQVAESNLPTKFGADFKIKVFKSSVEERETLALVLGDESQFQNEATLVRVHSECLTGDVFGSLRCDCGDQLEAALRQISKAGSGVLLYLRQEGRGIGLSEKIKAYALQESCGLDTVEANQALGFSADLRKYGLGAQILRQLGLRKMKLLSNNPKKIIGLQGFGLEVVERVPLEIASNPANSFYLQTKKEKLGHLLS